MVSYGDTGLGSPAARSESQSTSETGTRRVAWPTLDRIYLPFTPHPALTIPHSPTRSTHLAVIVVAAKHYAYRCRIVYDTHSSLLPHQRREGPGPGERARFSRPDEAAPSIGRLVPLGPHPRSLSRSSPRSGWSRSGRSGPSPRRGAYRSARSARRSKCGGGLRVRPFISGRAEGQRPGALGPPGAVADSAGPPKR